MMFGQGLSLDQAPPFSAPFRFFITAPLFGVLAGIVLTVSEGKDLVDADALAFIGIVHLLTLGFVTMVMMGAMQQMLPVIAGVRFRAPMRNAWMIHIGMVAGTLLFVGGFLFASISLLMTGVGLLLVTILFFAAVVGVGLRGVTSQSDSVRAFGFAVTSLVIAVGLGASAGLLYGGLGSYSGVASLHISWIVFGWIVLLVIGVSFQVVPMFYVTEAYPAFCRRYGVGLIFGMLVAITTVSIGEWYADWIVPAAHLVIVLLVSGYGAITLRRLMKRKRAVKESTIYFWYTAMGSLMVGVVGWYAGSYILPHESLRLGASVLFGTGFVLSLINAMLYKIVPFLVWFHLTNMGYFPVPTMRELIAEQWIRRHLSLHVISILAFLAGALFSPLFYTVAGLFFALANGVLFRNLYRAGRVFFVKSKEPRSDMAFDMGSFTKKD
jgi:hypothetical protein